MRWRDGCDGATNGEPARGNVDQFRRAAIRAALADPPCPASASRGIAAQLLKSLAPEGIGDKARQMKKPPAGGCFEVHVCDSEMVAEVRYSYYPPTETVEFQLRLNGNG
jgi:hypothetical protein